ELTHYPLKLSEPDSVSGVEVEIEESKDTTKVSVRTQKESTSDSEASNSDGRVHIIENPSPELWLVALRLEWSAAENRIWALSVETSDDLQNWRMHKARVFIAKMSHQGSRLERKSITLLPTRARYLRLSWLDEAIGGTITSIAGEYTSTKPLRKNWTQIPKPTFDAAAKEVLFSTQGPFPVRDIEFIFRKDGILLDGQLFSRQTNDAEWRRITHIQQYRLAATDSQIIATPLQIATSRDREWKIALTQPAHLADDEVPDIKIGWSPVVIDFVAQGQGPYILAYGNPQAKPVSGDLSALRGDITPEDVEIISVSELGGEQILEEKTSETQWKKILLWLVLVASVVFMGRMAFVLYREIA
ncbi:DUF3999 family protein, partial [Myxococcota bacterium]|nr:DUF3999 family protein [Myxococcota bacterium]